jgi:putative ABC transport system permease protein
VHAETWTVVGVLEETHTANDRVLFIPLQSFYAITEHEEGLKEIGKVAGGEAGGGGGTRPAEAGDKAYRMNADGTFTLTLPQEEWRVSAVLVQAQSVATLLRLQFLLRNRPDAMGVLPAATMGDFFENVLPAVSALLLLISLLVTAVAGVSILVSIYNSVSARNREIAILRALGATRGRILAAVCLEAGMVGTAGGVLGWVGGHILAAGGAWYLQRLMGTGLPWWRVDAAEGVYLLAVVAMAFGAGLVPALKAYRVPVAEHLAG